ncbi:MaoC family dehydratase [Streptomyces sp. SBST2-5]|uniref:MaoC family dehydratase n=1 Tax=Streptomyces composti TaxID=2720025 RepID=A0ABX1AEZ4_9ACTN|nr:MaoC family dehydratase N-terminal domain-containing protein [Streptomyces composti]NJP53847.1 MaoC family dehydratase [Streptomyces composti]
MRRPVPDSLRTAGPWTDGGRYVVEREKIREFAAAVGADDPAYTDPGAARALGYPDVLAPPTFLVAAAARAEDRLLRHRGVLANPSGTLHRAQRFVHHRPVCAGEELRVRVRLAERSRLGGRDVLVLESEFRAADGSPVSTVTSTLLTPEDSPSVPG